MSSIAENGNQRMWDLIRHQRIELYAKGLITYYEYLDLALNHPAVARLENYDVLVAELAALRELLARKERYIADLRTRVIQ